MLQDQLLQCTEVSLRRMLQNTIGTTTMEKITVTDLIMDIERAAVEKQSELLNKVRLMEANQERDEPVRIFVARLHGLANIFVLSHPAQGGPANRVYHTLSLPSYCPWKRACMMGTPRARSC